MRDGALFSTPASWPAGGVDGGKVVVPGLHHARFAPAAAAIPHADIVGGFRGDSLVAVTPGCCGQIEVCAQLRRW